jgi:hypothetical protein
MVDFKWSSAHRYRLSTSLRLLAIVLVIAAAIIATQVLQIGQIAESKIAQNRDNTISTLLS